jgi:hypothetical protein
MADRTTKKKFRVVDIPAGATAEQAEQLLNSVCDEGYTLARFSSLGVGTGAERMYFKLPAKLERED